MNAEISGLLLAGGVSVAPGARRLARRALARSRTATCAKNSASLPLADIDMLLWIRHLSLTAAPRRQYPDL
jgi:hypothetical protein